MYETNSKLVFEGLSKEKRDKLVGQLKKAIMPDDVIAGLFSFLTVEKIPLSSNRIHSAVYKLKGKYPEMFEDFVFSTKDYYPYSALLERVLFRLQNADIINTINPDFKKCIVSKESKEYVKKKILPLFGTEEQKKLEDMGKIFQDAVCAAT